MRKGFSKMCMKSLRRLVGLIGPAIIGLMDKSSGFKIVIISFSCSFIAVEIRALLWILGRPYILLFLDSNLMRHSASSSVRYASNYFSSILILSCMFGTFSISIF